MRCIKIIFVFCVFCSGIRAQQVGSIAEGQAIFIYNFTKLIAWPETRKENQFIIGILGNFETFNALKEHTKQKSVSGRNILVKYFRKASEVDACHMLMIASSEMKEFASIVGKAETESILLIGEKIGAIDEGAAINLLLVGGKIKYEMKSSNLTKCQLKYVSQLEGLAYKKY